MRFLKKLKMRMRIVRIIKKKRVGLQLSFFVRISFVP